MATAGTNFWGIGITLDENETRTLEVTGDVTASWAGSSPARRQSSSGAPTASRTSFGDCRAEKAA
jgi:hypothetical protein